jgi:polysaccharide export outer membrane protein
MKTSIAFSLLFLLSTAPIAAAQAPSASARPADPADSSGPNEAVRADYRIGPGDKLRIEVYKDTQLSQALQVRPDGKITLPLIGDVVAEGRTATELRDALASSLKEYNNSPVTVIVVETVPPMFYVMGEVKSPGTLPLKGQISAVQALAMAGGFTDFAKKNDIVIQRKGQAGITSVKFSYNDAVKGRAPMLYLQPGDTIIVP